MNNKIKTHRNYLILFSIGRGYSIEEMSEVFNISVEEVKEIVENNKQLKVKSIKPETIELMNKVVELKSKGMTNIQVAEIIGKSSGRVSELMKLNKELNN